MEERVERAFQNSWRLIVELYIILLMVEKVEAWIDDGARRWLGAD
jgi:hypothetical protein